MQEIESKILEQQFLGVSVENWLLVLGVWLGVTFVFVVVRKILAARLDRLAGRTKNAVDDTLSMLVNKTRFYFLAALALVIAVHFVPLTDRFTLYISRAAFLILLIQVIAWGNQLITDWIRRYKERKLEEDAAAVTTMQAVGFIARILLYTTVILVALDNLGVNVTTFIAGLGIGGVAVALALQNILGDLFASLSIVLDKPFVVGDFLNVNEFSGTVEQVGLKTTRLRSLSGEQIIFSNSDLLNSRIRNYKRMFERRIAFKFGVLYETPIDKLEKIPGMVRDIIEGKKDIRFDRAHFQGFGDSALNFEVVYYVLVPDYNVYMDRQQAINLELMQTFAREGIGFAYPTRTLYVSNIGNNARSEAESTAA